ncbi:hypothetical protein CS022_20395 [Veronia nyctiphanis]|uniref:PKD domain-containing protein n=1 Tax=Veronia nyctiphanis TaxID=1278244 RepID=A0A4Q0YLB4_9GAMM|nr:M4 family metallopeptidase [Veronia nyctiphanis]RXJ71572.1 hypothetical protein CS022_20395 [Veronia nyctiphanis]
MKAYPKVSAVAIALAGIISLPALAADRINLDAPTIFAANAAQSVISNDAFVEGASFVAANGDEIVRIQQTYQGLPVFGESFAATKNSLGFMTAFTGTAISGIDKDIASVEPSVKANTAVSTLASEWQHEIHRIHSPQKQLVVWLDAKDVAHLAWYVSYTIYGSNPTRPMGFVDAKSGKLLDSWDGLNHAEATGPGGNGKTGRYEFGPGKRYGSFEVRQNGSTCTLDSPNVETLDMRNRTSGGSVHSFTCPENTERQVNGAFSAMNDAHAFGLVTFDMYKEWYGIRPITQKLRLRVHYDSEYENAFWDGRQMTFGDGKNTFYPLVSLDVVAHEVSHGVTSQNSNLVYRNQSGGMNEAFSDVSAAAALYYLEGDFNWKIGDRIKKGSGAMRYMDNPPLDGKSIGHARDFTNGMNVHYSSGVFNKAFYLLSNKEGWDIRKAFDAYIKANQVYWTANSTFDQGGAGVYKAAEALGYCVNDVVDAFDVVGVTTGARTGSGCGGGDELPVAGFNTSVDGLKVAFNNTSQFADSYSWTFGDGNEASSMSPVHTYGAEGTYSVSLSAKNSLGEDTKSLNVTVVEKCDDGGNGGGGDANAWSETKSYKVGDIVTYNGSTYEATWWSTGARPDIYTNVWKKVQGLVVFADCPPVNDAPVANFSSVVNDLTITLTDSSTDDKGVVSRTWSVNGSVLSSADKVVNHTVASAGDYSVVLTVKDAEGLSSSKSVTVKVGSTGGCAPAWDAGKIYNTGDQISHNGKKYEAKWWTQGQEPGTTGQWGVWKDLGACN